MVDYFKPVGMRSLRVVSLLFGVPLLLLGICGITLDIATQIQYALNHDTHHRVITTFPLGTITGPIFLWLGYRLLVTRSPELFLPTRHYRDLKRDDS